MLDKFVKLVYNGNMSKQPIKTRIQINVRLTQAQIEQLEDLTIIYGSQSRAITTALETLWRGTAEERRRFIPQPDTDTPDATPPDGD